MEIGSSQSRDTKRIRSVTAGSETVTAARRVAEAAGARGDVTMQPEVSSGRHNSGAAAHPLAELLACPPAVGNLLNASAEQIGFEAGDIVFHQGGCLSGPLCGAFRTIAAQSGTFGDAAYAWNGQSRGTCGTGGCFG